jgi:hypothetical protein
MRLRAAVNLWFLDQRCQQHWPTTSVRERRFSGHENQTDSDVRLGCVQHEGFAARMPKPTFHVWSGFGFHALKIFSLGQKSSANAAGTADPKNRGVAAAREEHCLDNGHALHATGTTRHS